MPRSGNAGQRGVPQGVAIDLGDFCPRCPRSTVRPLLVELVKVDDIEESAFSWPPAPGSPFARWLGRRSVRC